MIRVLIADDHEVVRQGLRAVLEQEPDIEIVGDCGDGEAAVAAIERLKPDVIVLDMLMPRLDGLGVLERLREHSVRPAVIVLTSYMDEDRGLAAVRAGAQSYLPKTMAADRVVEVVRATAAGGSVLDPGVAAAVVQRVRGEGDDDRLGMLSPREREVLVMLSRGRSNREIARKLSLSEETVKSYVSGVLAKLGLQDRTQAAIFGLQRGLVPLGSALSDEQGGAR